MLLASRYMNRLMINMARKFQSCLAMFCGVVGDKMVAMNYQMLKAEKDTQGILALV